MFQQAANVMDTILADIGIVSRLEELIFLVLPQTLVNVHAGTVILEQRFGHEGRSLAPAP